MKFEQYLSEGKNKKFKVGGVSFEAVKFDRPTSHWRLKLPSGEIWETGTGGISNVSVPKMKKDLEYFLDRFGQKEFAKQIGNV